MTKLTRAAPRQQEMLDLLGRMARRHPELTRRVRWSDVLAIAEREGIAVRAGPLSRRGRIIRLFGSFEIQIESQLGPEERAFVGMHELVHYWCDFGRESTCYPEDERSEAFADLVADHLTSVSRCLEGEIGPCVRSGHVPGLPHASPTHTGTVRSEPPEIS